MDMQAVLSVLNLLTPIAVGVIGYIFATQRSNFDQRMTSLEKQLYDVEARAGRDTERLEERYSESIAQLKEMLTGQVVSLRDDIRRLEDKLILVLTQKKE